MKNHIFSIWQVATVGVGKYAFYFNIFAYTICLGLCFWIRYEWSDIGSFFGFEIGNYGFGTCLLFIYLVWQPFGFVKKWFGNGIFLWL